MVGTLIRMKVALLRGTTTGERGMWMLTGATVGVLLAAGTIVLSLWRLSDPGLLPDLLAVVYLTWGIGWILGPLRASAPLLRAEHFAMLPIPRRRLAAGLLATAFVGVGAPVTLLALVSLATYAGRLGIVAVLVAIPAAALQLVVLVTLSRVAAAMFAKVARVRTGAALNGALLAIVMVLLQSGWMLIVGLAVSDVLTDGFPAHWSTALRAAPTGWGLVAIEAADDSAWLLALAALAGMVVLITVSMAVWGRTLGEPRGGRAVIRGPRLTHGRPGRAAAGPTGAVMRKELRTWWRDPVRTSAIVGSITWGAATALLPLTFDEKVLLPWAAPLIAVMAATYMANLYGYDGTGIWLTIQTATERTDLRARQLAYLAVFTPITVAVAVGFTTWSDMAWTWPWVLGLLAATLGGGAGLVAWFSVYTPSPGLDPHQRADNPLETSDDDIGSGFVVFFAALVPPLPAAGLLTLGMLRDDPVLTWAGTTVGIATGIGVAWWLGHLAAKRLAATAPELLFLMRTGRAVTTTVDDADAPEPNMVLQTVAWTLGSLALFAQGIVPIVMKLSGNHDVKVWFLAMYLPEPVGWITAITMITIGATLYGVALVDLRRSQQTHTSSPS